jgi:hypothetical protein
LSVGTKDVLNASFVEAVHRSVDDSMICALSFILLGIEANEVVSLRIMKITSGGPAAMSEVQLMIAEKMAAAAEAGTSLICGHSPMAVVARYREHVANNRQRLLA